MLESRALQWGGSSAGRASRSQCEGRGFDPLPLQSFYEIKQNLIKSILSIFEAPLPQRESPILVECLQGFSTLACVARDARLMRSYRANFRRPMLNSPFASYSVSGRRAG